MSSKTVQQKIERATTPIPVELNLLEIKHLLKLHLGSWQDDPTNSFMQSTNSFTFLAMKLQSAYNRLSEEASAE